MPARLSPPSNCSACHRRSLWSSSLTNAENEDRFYKHKRMQCGGQNGQEDTKPLIILHQHSYPSPSAPRYKRKHLDIKCWFKKPKKGHQALDPKTWQIICFLFKLILGTIAEIPWFLWNGKRNCQTWEMHFKASLCGELQSRPLERREAHHVGLFPLEKFQASSS